MDISTVILRKVVNLIYVVYVMIKSNGHGQNSVISTENCPMSNEIVTQRSTVADKCKYCVAIIKCKKCSSYEKQLLSPDIKII